MIGAIRALDRQPRPSQAISDGLLDGLDFVTNRVNALLRQLPREAAE